MWHPISKVEGLIRQKIVTHKPGLYLDLLFPIATTFLLTFIGSRIIGYLMPWLYLEIGPGLHVHHFTYGVFILALTSYLGLIFEGPKAKFWIAGLFGFGLGLAFDEFAMWLNLSDDNPLRWDYDGFIIVASVFVVLLTFHPGLAFIQRHLPFSKKRLK